MNTVYKTPDALFHEIAGRAKAYRISYPLTQKQLADKAGVSLRSIQRFEGGGDIQVTTLLRILEALGLSDHVPGLIPDVTDRPSAHLPQYKPRQRVRINKDSSKNRTFQWGDEK